MAPTRSNQNIQTWASQTHPGSPEQDGLRSQASLIDPARHIDQDRNHHASLPLTAMEESRPDPRQFQPAGGFVSSPAIIHEFEPKRSLRAKTKSTLGSIGRAFKNPFGKKKSEPAEPSTSKVPDKSKNTKSSKGSGTDRAPAIPSWQVGRSTTPSFRDLGSPRYEAREELNNMEEQDDMKSSVSVPSRSSGSRSYATTVVSQAEQTSQESTSSVSTFCDDQIATWMEQSKSVDIPASSASTSTGDPTAAPIEENNRVNFSVSSATSTGGHAAAPIQEDDSAAISAPSASTLSKDHATALIQRGDGTVVSAPRAPRAMLLGTSTKMNEQAAPRERAPLVTSSSVARSVEAHLFFPKHREVPLDLVSKMEASTPKTITWPESSGIPPSHTTCIFQKKSSSTTKATTIPDTQGPAFLERPESSGICAPHDKVQKEISSANEATPIPATQTPTVDDLLMVPSAPPRLPIRNPDRLSIQVSRCGSTTSNKDPTAVKDAAGNKPDKFKLKKSRPASSSYYKPASGPSWADLVEERLENEGDMRPKNHGNPWENFEEKIADKEVSCSYEQSEADTATENADETGSQSVTDSVGCLQMSTGDEIEPLMDDEEMVKALLSDAKESELSESDEDADDDVAARFVEHFDAELQVTEGHITELTRIANELDVKLSSSDNPGPMDRADKYKARVSSISEEESETIDSQHNEPSNQETTAVEEKEGASKNSARNLSNPSIEEQTTLSMGIFKPIQSGESRQPSEHGQAPEVGQRPGQSQYSLNAQAPKFVPSSNNRQPSNNAYGQSSANAPAEPRTDSEHQYSEFQTRGSWGVRRGGRYNQPRSHDSRSISRGGIASAQSQQFQLWHQQLWHHQSQQSHSQTMPRGGFSVTPSQQPRHNVASGSQTLPRGGLSHNSSRPSLSSVDVSTGSVVISVNVHQAPTDKSQTPNDKPANSFRGIRNREYKEMKKLCNEYEQRERGGGAVANQVPAGHQGTTVNQTVAVGQSAPNAPPNGFYNSTHGHPQAPANSFVLFPSIPVQGAPNTSPHWPYPSTSGYGQAPGTSSVPFPSAVGQSASNSYGQTPGTTSAPFSLWNPNTYYNNPNTHNVLGNQGGPRN